MTIAISFIGFGFCKLYRYYVKNQRDSLLQPPFDLSGGMTPTFRNRNDMQ